MAAAQTPGPLEVVRQFANTLDVEDGTDELSTPAALAAWLSTHGLDAGVGRVDEDDLALARDARDAVRALIAANHHPPAPDADLAALDRIVRAAGLTPVFRPREFRLEPQVDGVAGALGRILTHVAESMTAGTWSRLKLCVESTCAWAFYDTSRNQSRRWCSMAVCGNRTKVRTYRARRTG